MSRLFAVLVGLSVVGLAVPAFSQAQDNNRVTSMDVPDQAASPVPENGDIIVQFGDSARLVYFKYPIKSIRLDDEFAVKAVPQSDHTVAFTGLHPGRSRVTMERPDGKTDSYRIVTVVRQPHEVRVYQSREINKQSGERRSDSSSAIGGYVSLQCNEIRCDELEPPLQPKLPK
jgi:hypothetical protein